MTKYQENFIHTTSFIKKLLKIKMVTLLLGHPVVIKLIRPTVSLSAPRQEQLPSG